MSIDAAYDWFTAYNLDPALAEAVASASPEQVIEGILRLEDPDQVPPQVTVVSRFHRICTGRFPAAQAWAIRRHPNVISLKASRPLGIHDDAGCRASPIRVDEAAGSLFDRPFTGRGVIVAALDFGLDFAHPNFLRPDGTTRLLAFWHQGAPYDPAYPNRFGYGRFFGPAEVNTALRASDAYRALGYHPAISDTGSGSHGTHTLDIAAGNGQAPGARAGMAPDAGLIFVHLSTPRLGAVGDLGDSVRLLEALDFVETEARGRPWVVNLSVGRTAGSHDGTSLVEQGMHELLRRGPGRAIVQSAGNYRSADLAVEGRLRDGEHRDLDWIIDPVDTTPNEIDVWYSGKDRFVVALRSPHGAAFLPVKLGRAADVLHDGIIVGRIYHRRTDPNNGDNHVEVFLYPGAPPGVWTLRLSGDYVINGRFHAWIERDLARPGAQSRFGGQIATRSYTLGTIATSPLVITVGAYDANTAGGPSAPFSSCGPTRDERRDKPELLAPGVRVLAARSTPRAAPRPEGLLVARSGTSMAAPHVAGTVAAMFEAANRAVSIDEIRECLKRSAEPVTESEPADCCAWGRLNTAGAIREIRGSRQVEPISASLGDALALGPPLMTSEPATPDAAAGEFASAREEQDIAVPLYKGPLMAAESFLGRADHALRRSYGRRCESEISFLGRLLRELAPDMSVVGLSPAELLRAVLQDRPLMNRARNVLNVIAMPLQRPDGALRPGDWMLRAIPGTGDVGHVSVLASGDLLTPSALAAEGIAIESAQPGYYGLVIEAGAFPHNRSRPFARRWLDSAGRVPPNTILLRPRFLQVRTLEALSERETGILRADHLGEDVPAGLLTEHLWQEWHASQAPARYSGHAADDRRVVENTAPGGALVAKPRLHLCFLERAVATFAADVAEDDYWAKWEIIDSTGASVKAHVNFSIANFNAGDAAAKLTTGRFAWMWDGRNNARDPVFMPPGRYRSRITVKDRTGATLEFTAPIELDGEPYTILIVGQPKSDVDLEAALANPPGGAAWRGRLLNSVGERIGNDCWLKVFRGRRDDGHAVFLGHGTIEATMVNGPPNHGAIQTPHGVDYKGWIRRDPGSEANSIDQPDRVQIEDVGSTNQRITLPSSAAEPVSNPYTDHHSRGAFKDGVQAHAGAVETRNGLSVGCTTSCRIAGHTCRDPGAESDGVRSINSAFGTWGGPGEDAGRGGPRFVNKQTKRGVAGALLGDDHAAPLLDPPGPAACGGRPDEPLHMQETMQGAVFGGFKGHEIPLSARVADAPVNQLRIRMRLENYAVGSRYHAYHHAVAFGHEFEVAGRDLTVRLWIPRKVIRGWNGNRRNVLVRGGCQIRWTLEYVPEGATERVPLHQFTGAAGGDLVDLPNADIGKAQRRFRLPDPVPARRLFSVFRYRLQLLPFVDGIDAWVAEGGYADSLSRGTANLSREVLSTAEGNRFATGANELAIPLVP